MEVFTFCPKAYFGSNCYVIKSDEKYAIIDPSVAPDEILCSLPSFCPEYIILTHAHFDHILFVDEFKARFPDATVIVHKNDAQGLHSAEYNASVLFLDKPLMFQSEYRCVEEGETISLGNETMRFYSFPGHTEGSIAIQCGASVFVGDLVFKGGSFGRVDLPSGSITQMRASLEKFARLFRDVFIIYPGHGPAFSY